MNELEGLLDAVVADPLAEDRWSVLADWLEENDDPLRAELLRLHRRLIATCCQPDEHPERAAWQARLVRLLAEGLRHCVPQRILDLGGGVEMTFNFVPPGTFLMGSPPNEPERRDDETQHRVTLTKGYWLGVHPVTQAQWQAVMGSNPSSFKGDNLPVETVSWDECHEFGEKLGRKTGKRLRLPTEAEWEHAARAGTTTPFSFGDTISTDQANYDGNYTDGQGKKGVSREQTMPVGSFPANAWGLHDMHGNVWEWCSGWYGPNPNEDIRDPQGVDIGTPHDHRSVCVLRGGSWFHNPGKCRSAYRVRSPSRRRDICGCRVLLCLD